MIRVRPLRQLLGLRELSIRQDPADLQSPSAIFAGARSPTHPLRNGRLNQTAFSFFFFVRDVAGSDLFRWIDDQLSTATKLGYSSAQEALIGPMRHIFGVSDKVLTMTLSSVLMADRKSAA